MAGIEAARLSALPFTFECGVLRSEKYQRWDLSCKHGKSTCLILLLLLLLLSQADVINRGFGGFNTKTALLALPEIIDMLSKQQIALAVVWLGANDAASPEGSE